MNFNTLINKLFQNVGFLLLKVIKLKNRIFVITINAYEGMSSLNVKEFDKKWDQSKDLRPEKMTARKATEKRKGN